MAGVENTSLDVRARVDHQTVASERSEVKRESLWFERLGAGIARGNGTSEDRLKASVMWSGGELLTV